MPAGVRVHVPRLPVDTIAETDTDRTAANPAIPDICLRTSEQVESMRFPLARRRGNPRTAGCLYERISFPPRRNHPLRPDAGRVDPTARDSFNRLFGDPGRCPPCAASFDPTHDGKTPPTDRSCTLHMGTAVMRPRQESSSPRTTTSASPCSCYRYSVLSHSAKSLAVNIPAD